MNNRIEKGNSLLKKHISEIILNELNDPRLNNELLTISRVSLSSDLKYAKVFVSIFGNQDSKEVLAILQKASGHIRKLLVHKVDFRVLPILDFALDDSAEYSEKINNLLRDIKYSTESEEI